jgi:hypothetical protein
VRFNAMGWMMSQMGGGQRTHDMELADKEEKLSSTCLRLHSRGRPLSTNNPLHGQSGRNGEKKEEDRAWGICD